MWMVGVYIAIGVGGLVATMAMAMAAVFLYFQWKKRRNASAKNTTDLELQHLNLSIITTSEKKVSLEGSIDGSSVSNSNSDSRIPPDISVTPRKKTKTTTMVETFTIEELKKGTEDFNSANLIEDSVYHGRVNGKGMAIKRVSTEVVSKIDFKLLYDPIHHHPSITKLLGACVTEGQQHSYLVFEYANNGSLKDWLHGGLGIKSHFIASCNCFLTWNQRIRICLDVATALQFMHHVMNPPYVHRNIKSRNVFLDDELNAKVGNFGMANCVNEIKEKTEVQLQSYPSGPTLPVAYWSKGYLAPEYLKKGVISPGIDIFAYGVILLEILSGETPITMDKEIGVGGEVRLSDQIKLILESENVDELREWIDKALGDNYSFDAVVTMANLARACVEEDPSLRPNAMEIVEKVSKVINEMPQRDEVAVCEGSSRPLVKAAASSYRFKTIDHHGKHLK